MMQAKWDVYKITQMRDGAVYGTQKVTSIWLDIPTSDAHKRKAAQEHGGDMLAPTLQTRIVRKGTTA